MKIKITIFLAFLVVVQTEGQSILTLKDCLRLAEENNLQLKSVALDIQKAEFSRQEMFTNFLPRLSSSATYTYLGRPVELSLEGFPQSIQLTRPNLYSFSLMLKQPVFTGGLLTASYQQAVENVKLASHQYQAEKERILLEVEKTYFAVLKAQKAAEVTRELKKQAEEHRRVANSLFQQGMVTKLDILKTDVFLAQVNSAMVETDNAIRIARSSLAQLLNQSLSQELEIQDILEADYPELPLSHWQNLARDNRPELKVFNSLRQIAEKGVTLAKSNYYPQIGLVWAFTEEKGNQTSPDHWRPSWNLVLAVNLDIWNWHATRDKVQRAQSELSQVQNRYLSSVSSIELEVKTAYLNWQAARERIKLAKSSLAEAEENLRLTNLAYKEGVATTTDVLDAQVALAKARESYYLACYDYQVGYRQLRRAAGTAADFQESSEGKP